MRNLMTRRFFQTAMLGIAAAGLGLTGAAAVASGPGGDTAPVAVKDDMVVRISGKEISLIPQLTQALGNFEKEGVRVDLVDDTVYEGPHYRMPRGLNNKQIDMSVHWFQHVYFGRAHNEPVTALMMFNSSPGLTIMVANRVKDRVRSAADFRGLRVAEGMGYSTKSVIMNLLAARAGLPPKSYTPILSAPEGRMEGTLRALETGEVDVIAFRDPQTTEILATGKVTTIYDLTTPEKTAKVLGASFPAQSLFATPQFLRAHPEIAQRVTNAFVRTMRFVNTHSAEEILAAMPPEFMKNKTPAQRLEAVREMLPTFTTGNFAFTPKHAGLMQQAIDAAQYDNSVEGQYRAVARGRQVPLTDLYDNRFVNRAMKRIRR